MIPDPGVYHDVPFHDYLAWEAINNSSLDPLERSPAHYLAALTHPKAPTCAMRLGTFLHAGCLEPESVRDRYIVMPRFEDEIRRPDGTEYANVRATKAYRERASDFRDEAEADGKEVVPQDWYDVLIGVSKALASEPRVKNLFARMAVPDGSTTETEVSIVWEDPATRLLCKARIDFLDQAHARMCDLKTSTDVSQYEWDLWRRRIHRQVAFHGDGLETLGVAISERWIIAAEVEEPFGVRAAPVSQSTLAVGRAEYRRALQTIARCRDLGQWPGYASPETWDLPECKMPPIELMVGGQAVTV